MTVDNLLVHVLHFTCILGVCLVEVSVLCDVLCLLSIICCYGRLVQYESADSAERALIELQESVLDGRRLFLRKVCQLL